MKLLSKLATFALIGLGLSINARQYTPGATNAIPLQQREEMRRMFREYTRENKTSAYLTTCGYMYEIIAKAKQKGLSSADTMNLAYENIEYFLEEQRTCVYEHSPSLFVILAGLPHADTAYLCRSGAVERALYIRKLIYECDQFNSMSVVQSQGTQQINVQQTNIKL